LTLIAEGELLISPSGIARSPRPSKTCALKPATFGQVMNLATRGDHTRQYYQTIADILGVPLRYDSVPAETFRREHADKRPFARHRVYDLTKLRTLAGYEPARRFALPSPRPSSDGSSPLTSQSAG
jgi:hypothetical protein